MLLIDYKPQKFKFILIKENNAHYFYKKRLNTNYQR